MACGETGRGRMIEATEILQSIEIFLKHLLLFQVFCACDIRSGTYEPIDPVRFIGNRSSGKQGHAIATALARAGATVTLVLGPVSLPDPVGVQTIHVETAHDMRDACLNALPSDLAVCAAAVCRLAR